MLLVDMIFWAHQYCSSAACRQVQAVQPVTSIKSADHNRVGCRDGQTPSSIITRDAYARRSGPARLHATYDMRQTSNPPAKGAVVGGGGRLPGHHC